METLLLVLLIVGIVAYFALGSRTVSAGTRSTTSSSTSSRNEATARQRTLEANEPWLRERWRMADAEKAAGNLQHFPRWYFEEATERQRERLERDGVRLTRSASKGQHSDVIGLFVEPDAEDLEKLKFFGVKLERQTKNQTRARHEVAKLDADPDKRAAWRSRPASVLQKEFYRFIGEKPPAGLTHERAEASISEKLERLTEAQQDEWSTFESLVEEFDDRELRSDLEIRKPTPGDIRTAMAALKAEGKTFDDPYDVAEKLLQIKPALSREASR